MVVMFMCFLCLALFPIIAGTFPMVVPLSFMAGIPDMLAEGQPLFDSLPLFLLQLAKQFLHFFLALFMAFVMKSLQLGQALLAGRLLHPFVAFGNNLLRCASFGFARFEGIKELTQLFHPCRLSTLDFA